MMEVAGNLVNLATGHLISFPVIWITVASVFLLAGLVKGVVGMGLPTVAMGLLAITMPPAQGAAILIIPSFVTNIWQLLAGPSFKRLFKRLWTMMAGVAVGTVAGSGWLTGGHTGVALSGLGAALTIYAMLGLLQVRFQVSVRYENLLSPLVGLITGLVTGATGVFVIPAVPYLQALMLEKEELIQALGLSFTVSTIALALGLALHADDQMAPVPLLGVSLLALIPALLGMFIGQMLRARMSAEAFRRVFFSGLLLLGIYLAITSLS
ncbi:putative membrane protein YfcA [Phyllobacterium ifriqiyense]|uniref:Probable membrane transporter protein n=1 Tax=Phyllobacterium ifriqiyense TaxID=314238 RepID=A0ABU0SAX6_9HYPH|nr:sulfite exporter TauE/SafE family protein [Phyllobacterium ifriqiyense]MDQ0997888.1 putative membrane protein YfcA [Phyllobacterium ifriqiyense]